MSRWPKTRAFIHTVRFERERYRCLQCLYPITCANTPLTLSLSDKSLCFQREAVSLQATWKDDVRMSLLEMIPVTLRFLCVCGTQAQCEHAQVSISHNSGCLLRLVGDKQTGWTRSCLETAELCSLRQDFHGRAPQKVCLWNTPFLTCVWLAGQVPVITLWWEECVFPSWYWPWTLEWDLIWSMVFIDPIHWGLWMSHPRLRVPQIQWWVSV